MVTKPARLGGSLSSSTSRSFVYEVEGLRQNLRSDQSDYAIRTSDNVFITVPLNRMNQEMRRITRLGGKIVGIHTSTPAGETSADNASADESSEES